MRPDYSFKKSLAKGLFAVLGTASVLIAFAGLSDISVNDLYTAYVQPTFGALTVGGLFKIAANYVKFNWL